MSEWIKCSERMPGDFEVVLASDGGNVEVMWWDCDGFWNCWVPRNSNISSEDATHWMSLPGPPEV